MWKCGIALGCGLLVFSSVAWGKPADLPASNQIECGEQPPRKPAIDVELGPKGVNVPAGFGDVQPDAPPLDPFFPAFVEHWLQHAADVLTEPQRCASVEALLGSLPYVRALKAAPGPMAPAPVVKGKADPQSDFDKQVQRLFERADFYRRTELYEAARCLYQRVHLLSPTSRLGCLAIEHLHEIERRMRESGNR